MGSCPKSYGSLVGSSEFQNDLSSLNNDLLQALSRFDAKPYLNGNLFYAHRMVGFCDAPLDPQMEEKRRKLFEIAQQGETFLEIGVNGGHSLLLAKSANPALKCIGIDICRQLDPSWGRVDVYTPKAMRWLSNRFPGDFHFKVGNSLVEAPKFVLDHPEAKIDILHVDGDKETYFRDIVNLRPALHSKSLIVVDDTNLRVVKRTVQSLVAAGIVEVHPDYSETSTQRYQHMVLRIR